MTGHSCQRCPIGKEKRARQHLRLGLEDSRWTIWLCDEHASALERDVYSWARLGEQVLDEDDIRITEAYLDEARRLAELRAKQSQPTFRVVPDEPEEEVIPEQEKEREPERFGDQVKIVRTQE